MISGAYGNAIEKIPVNLVNGAAEVHLTRHLENGIYFYSLFVDERMIEARKLVINN